MGTLKGWCTRALWESGVVTDATVWSRRGSTRYLWTEKAVQAAVRYVRDAQ